LKNHLEAKSVLVLDRCWRVINTTTPMKAFVDMAKNTATAVLCHGENDFEAVSWDKWIQLGAGENDECVLTKRGKILMPKIVIAVNFTQAKVIARRPKLTPSEVSKVYKGQCAYSGRYIGRRGSIDHVVPRSRGGSDSWDNVVWCDPKINLDKGALLPHEAGLPEPRRKKVLPKVFVGTVDPRPDRPEWNHFLPHAK